MGDPMAFSMNSKTVLHLFSNGSNAHGQVMNRRASRSRTSAFPALLTFLTGLPTACSTPPTATADPVPAAAPEPHHPRPHVAWLTLNSKLPDAALSDGTLTYADLEETRELRTVTVNATGAIRYGDKTWFDPTQADAGDAEAACRSGLLWLRRKGLADGFLELDDIKFSNGERRRVVFQVLHLFVDDKAPWQTSVAPIFNACARPGIGFETIDLHCDPAIVPQDFLNRGDQH
jgi:hypothetical protein